MNLLYTIKEKLRNDRFLVLITFLFFIFMMLFRLTHSALWGDELVEYYYSQKAIRTGELYKAIVSTYQPPLYNFVMHFWLKINDSVFWFRFFNVVLGGISFWFLYGALRDLVGCRKACTGLIILAICYQWIYCIQECSEYALMLCGLFMALFFYIKCMERFSYAKMMGFVLSCVMAMYSQYGAAFVVAPLLGIFFCKVFFDKAQLLKRKIVVVAVYISCFFAFALPLYVLYAKIQMEHDAIANNSIHFKASMLKDIPFVFGKIFAWFFSIGDKDYASIIFGVLGLILLSVIIYGLIHSENWIKRSLLLGTLITYVMHYLLVQLHIYATVYGGRLSGFYDRYSYFYIPLMAVVVPIIYDELKELLGQNRILKLACTLLAGTVLFVSFVGILQNWQKAYTDQMGKIWVDNKGWENITYLYGGASPWGIRFYAGRSSECPDNYLKKVKTSVDNNKLPDRFWLWANDWGNDGWKVTVDKAKKLGYAVEIYVDHGNGKLAYCHRVD